MEAARDPDRSARAGPNAPVHPRLRGAPPARGRLRPPAVRREPRPGRRRRRGRRGDHPLRPARPRPAGLPIACVRPSSSRSGMPHSTCSATAGCGRPRRWRRPRRDGRAPGPEERAESREKVVRLREAMARMRPGYREAIVLRFGLGLSVPEIAEQLEISLPAAKKLVLRSTAQIRERMEAIDGRRFCPQMRELAQRSVLDGEIAGIAEEADGAAIRAHLEHCGPCRGFLTALRSDLHELGGGSSSPASPAGRLGPTPRRASTPLAPRRATRVARLRLASYRASGASAPEGGDPAGLLPGPDRSSPRSAPRARRARPPARRPGSSDRHGAGPAHPSTPIRPRRRRHVRKLAEAGPSTEGLLHRAPGRSRRHGSERQPRPARGRVARPPGDRSKKRRPNARAHRTRGPPRPPRPSSRSSASKKKPGDATAARSEGGAGHRVAGASKPRRGRPATRNPRRPAHSRAARRNSVSAAELLAPWGGSGQGPEPSARPAGARAFRVLGSRLELVGRAPCPARLSRPGRAGSNSRQGSHIAGDWRSLPEVGAMSPRHRRDGTLPRCRGYRLPGASWRRSDPDAETKQRRHLPDRRGADPHRPDPTRIRTPCSRSSVGGRSSRRHPGLLDPRLPSRRRPPRPRRPRRRHGRGRRGARAGGWGGPAPSRQPSSPRSPLISRSPAGVPAGPTARRHRRPPPRRGASSQRR